MASVGKKTVTRYKLDGHFVHSSTPGAKKIREKSDDYYGYWTEAGKQKSVRFHNCRSKAAAQALLQQHLKKLSEERAGLRPPASGLTPLRQKPLEELLALYLRHLSANNRDAFYISEQKRMIERGFAEIPLHFPGDLTLPGVYQWALQLRHKLQKDGLASARTREMHRHALCAFTCWMASPEAKLLLADPLTGMRKIRGQVVRIRRSLTVQDLQKLLDAARLRPLHNWQTIRRRGLTGSPVMPPDALLRRLELAGRQRALVYKFAALTLARYSAIRLLTVASLQLDQQTPVAVFQAAEVKRGESLTKPLPPSLVADLRAWLFDTNRTGNQRLFDMPNQMTRELRKDLAFAGIPYKDELGRTFDFHAFKKCGITALAEAKVDVRLAQEYAEHKDVRLTLQTYNDIQGRPMQELFNALPNVQ